MQTNPQEEGDSNAVSQPEYKNKNKNNNNNKRLNSETITAERGQQQQHETKKRRKLPPQDANCLRWRNGLKIHKGCRNDSFTHIGYKLPVIHCDQDHYEYIVVNKPCDIVLNVPNESAQEWNLLGLLQRDFSHMIRHAQSEEKYSTSIEEGNDNNASSHSSSSCNKDLVQNNRSFKLCHQIDYETSGICVIATTSEAASSIAQAFANRQVEKYYVMMVYGTVDFSQIRTDKQSEQESVWAQEQEQKNNNRLTITTYVKRNPKTGGFKAGKLKQCPPSDPLSNDPNLTADATTRFTVLAYGTYSNTGKQDSKSLPVTLIGARILTGRKHQLRLHCSYLGHPIVGDPIYGNKQWDIQSHAERTMLHSYYIKICAQSDCKSFKRGDFLEFWTRPATASASASERYYDMEVDKYLQDVQIVQSYKSPSEWSL